MVGTIIPIGHGERQHGRLSLSKWLYALGSVVGASIIGGVLGGFSERLMPSTLLDVSLSVTPLIVGIMCLAYSMHELGLVRLPMPERKRQVPAKWRTTMPDRLAAFVYGSMLGAGIFTYITVSTFYVPVIWSFLSRSMDTGALAMGAYGLGRGIPMIALASRRYTVEQAYALSELLANWKPAVHLLNGVALGIAGACLLLTGMAGI